MSDEEENTAHIPPDGDADVIDTDYEVGQHNVQRQYGPFEIDVHNPVFVISGLTIVLLVLFALIAPQAAGDFFGWLRPFLTSTFDWFFLSAGNIFVLVALGIMISPLGKVRIGGVEATPDYTYYGWFSMLFAAGMGIGLMFFGVLEPVYHMAFSAPAGAPLGVVDGAIVEADIEAARQAGMAATIYHWALHPWAVYAIVGLSLALFAYNKGLPLSVRSIFYPIFGERVWGWTGHIIDILAVFATLFGLATSLGIGAQQASAGLEYLFGWESTNISMVILICVITAIALISVVAGLDAGVQRLSKINMVLAALLLLFVIIVGPTIAILTGFFENLWYYARDIVPLSNPIGRTDDGFRQGWTSFYWAWWISWSPFVGMFIARISRGRSVREFIFCVLLIPSLVSVLWMTAFGGTAIDQVLTDGASQVKSYVIDSYSPELSLFGMLNDLPLASITSFVGIVLVIVFFVTSSDSGSLVIDTITAGGKLNAPTAQRVFWACFEGLVAIALLLGGGLAALQAASVSSGLPFAIVLLLGCWALIKGLMSEPRGK